MNNNKSRTENVIKNMKFAFVCQILCTLFSFFARTIFIKKLGAEYLGLNGLFTNILTILSFAELGIGDAIIFSMYKPIAEDDKEKIKSLLNLYKKSYIGIGIFIMIAGAALAPFIKYIIVDVPEIPESITIIYLMYVFHTASSYFFIYRQSVITANQKAYIITFYNTVYLLLINILQIIGLIVFNNFLLYLAIQIIVTFVGNGFISYKSKKMYPYTTEKNIAKFSKKEIKDIYTNIISLLVYKVGSVILNGTDNILISALIGVKMVGICSNYLLIISTVNTLLNKMRSALVASVGNLNATENPQKRKKIFEKLFLGFGWLYGLFAVGLFCLGNEAVYLWLGNEYVITDMTLFALAINFYVMGVHYPAFLFRTTLGLFKDGQAAPIIAAVVNLILSVVLAKYWGVIGIFIATPIARILGMGLFDPILVYKKGFESNPIEYYGTYLKYAVLDVVICMVCKYVIGLLNITNIFDLVLGVLIVFIIYNISRLCFSIRNEQFWELANYFKGHIRGKKND